MTQAHVKYKPLVHTQDNIICSGYICVTAKEDPQSSLV